jgi:hypothetical protein
MLAVIIALGSLTPLALPAPAPAAAGVLLRYGGPLGRVAEYRLTLDVTGEQVRLEERRPVRIRAELEFTEEVIAHERGDVLWLRVRARPLEVKDPTGTFVSGGRASWPEVRLRVTRRGEVLEAFLDAGGDAAGPPERALASLMMQPAPVVMPTGPVAAGGAWSWERDGAHQSNRLIGLGGEGATRVARVASTGGAPIELHEGSEALGLRTRSSGEQTQTSELEVLVSSGLVTRHRGQMGVATESEVKLALPEGPETFAMRSDLQIDFDLRLVRVDGKPFSRPW